MVYASGSLNESDRMPVRRPPFRRWLVVAAGIAYLGVIVVLLSPLWGAVSDETTSLTSVRLAPAGSPLKVALPGRVEAVPLRPPDSARVTPEGGHGPVGEELEALEGKSSETVPAETEPPPGTSSETRSNQGPVSGSGGGEEKSVIGFEG